MSGTITARDVVQDALERLQVYAPGETITDADAARGFEVLNDMVDSWNNENLTTYAVLEQTGMMVPGVTEYPIGLGATPPGFNLTRPLRINSDYGSAYLLDASSNKYPMKVIDRSTWNMQTTSIVTSNVPDTIFYDPQYPFGIINIWPVPNETHPFFWDSYLQISDFGTLETEFSLPPGYALAMKTNLSLLLKPYYPRGVVDQFLPLQAADSKGNVKRKNLRRQIAIYDSEIVARGSVTYNIYRDNFGR